MKNLNTKLSNERKILEEAEKIMLGDKVKKLDKVNYALSRTKK